MRKYKKGDMFVVEITDTSCKVGLGDFKYCLNGIMYTTKEMLDEFTRIVNGPYNEDYLAGYAKACEDYKEIIKAVRYMPFKIGDVVKRKNGGEKMIVTKITGKTTFCGVKENGQIYYGDIMNWKKTGKHYPEIEKLFGDDED